MHENPAEGSLATQGGGETVPQTSTWLATMAGQHAGCEWSPPLGEAASRGHEFGFSERVVPQTGM